MSRITTLLFVLTLILSACNSEEEQPRSTVEGRELDFTSTVQFLNEAGLVVSEIEVAVADNDESRSEGLMDVHNLPADSGMIFVFEDEQPRSFWMANTPISLDIIYASSDFEIVRIHRNTPPYSHENIHSEAPAMYVVEVNAGYTLRHDITEGMTIRFDP